MQRQQLEEIAIALPIFPLPRTVLMPGAVLPLHIFEPRYRALVAHCLESEPFMGLATLVDVPNADAQRPRVHDTIALGALVAHQPLPDGRSNIVLQYAGRVRMLGELPSPHPFRLVRGEVLDEASIGLDAALSSLRLLVLQLGAISLQATDEARRLIGLDGLEMVDALARKVFESPDEQLRYLAAPRMLDRVLAVEGRLATFLATKPPVGDA